ncbi:MAG: hypothetical protein WBO46_24495 [Caldilineaceae bacterium]
MSNVTVRNNSTTHTAKVNTTFFWTTGQVKEQRQDSIAPQASLTFPSPTAFIGSALAIGSEDLSMVVENINSFADGRYLAAAYPGATQPALVTYAPLVLKRWPTLNSNWRQTTDLFLYNPNPQSASATVTFYDSWTTDSGSYSVNLTIAANGRATVAGTQMPTWEASFGASMASARVSSNQPLVVTTRNLVGETDGNGVITTPYLSGSYLAEGSPATFYYAPIVAREYYGYDSSVQVQNASSGSTTFRVRFYPLHSGTASITQDITLGPYRSANFWRPTGMPTGFFGSATVQALYGGGPLSVMAQYDRFDTTNNRYGVTQYEGVSSLNAGTGMAHIQKSWPWTYTGIQAQNRNSNSANIQLHYFDTYGNSAGSSVTKSNVPTNAAVNFWSTSGTPPEIPSGLNGSGISGVSNVALQVNFDRLGDPTYQNKDGMMGYAAVK